MSAAAQQWWHMDEAEWYAIVVQHWTSSKIEAHDNEGVLGGWGEVDTEDAKGSLAFIRQCLGAPVEEPIAGYRALDCGAGVGRVTGNVLLHVAEQVHLVEVSERLLTQAQEKVRILLHVPATAGSVRATVGSSDVRVCV